jgi:acyl-CoA synthetase (NDP forming)
MHPQRELINEFLSSPRIAVVGVSRDPRDFTRQLWNAFRPLGAVPVHPAQHVVDGVRCAPSVAAINPRPTAALILVGRAQALDVLEECRAAGVGLVWIYGVTGPKSVPGEILRWCAAHDVRAVAGYCPFMFLPAASWPHRFHGTVAKFLGQYPA